MSRAFLWRRRSGRLDTSRQTDDGHIRATGWVDRSANALWGGFIRCSVLCCYVFPLSPLHVFFFFFFIEALLPLSSQPWIGSGFVTGWS